MSHELYPEIEPYRTGMLPVSDVHSLYYEESGNANGKPVIVIHGGPGVGSSPKYRRFFDPQVYRIILFDQRGCGKSLPYASLEDNTTWHCVADMEALRKHLDVDKWMLFGGSWGSTLSLAYAEKYPEAVSEMILRGIFLLTKAELDWFYQSGASNIFPDQWEYFIEPIREADCSNVEAYYKLLTGRDKDLQLIAARAWCAWEGSTSTLLSDRAVSARFFEDGPALALARIECHYFINGGFLKHEDQLLNDIDAVRHIPTTIVQGRYDMVCPMRSAWRLHKAWPEAEFVVVAGAGHAAMEPGICRELLKSADQYRFHRRDAVTG